MRRRGSCQDLLYLFRAGEMREDGGALDSCRAFEM